MQHLNDSSLIEGSAEPSLEDDYVGKIGNPNHDSSERIDRDGCLILEGDDEEGPNERADLGTTKTIKRISSTICHLGDQDKPGGVHNVGGGEACPISGVNAMMQVAEASKAYTQQTYASCHAPLSESSHVHALLMRLEGESSSPEWPSEAGCAPTLIQTRSERIFRGAWPLFGDLTPFGKNIVYDYKPKKGKRIFAIESPDVEKYSYLVTPSPLEKLGVCPSLRLVSVFTENIGAIEVPQDTERIVVAKAQLRRKANSSSSLSEIGRGHEPATVLTFASEKLARAIVWYAGLKANGVRFSASEGIDGSCMQEEGSAKIVKAGRKQKSTFNIFWGGRIKDEARLRSLEAFQRVNHLPGTWEMGRKDTLALHIRRAQQRFGNLHFGFAPQSYLLPQDLPLLRRDAAVTGTHASLPIFILKPPASACGRGIRLFTGPNVPDDLLKASEGKRAFNDAANGRTRSGASASDSNSRKELRKKRFTERAASDGGAAISESRSRSSSPSSSQSGSESDIVGAEEDSSGGAPDVPLVQRYIHNPLLINGYKFDLRIYVLCTSFEPFSLFIYNEGLVRFASRSYNDSNTDDTSMDAENNNNSNLNTQLKAQRNAGVADLDDVARHLTNYSINKRFTRESVRHSTDQNGADDAERMASKWSLHQLKRYFENKREAYLASLRRGGGYGVAHTYTATNSTVASLVPPPKSTPVPVGRDAKVQLASTSFRKQLGDEEDPTWNFGVAWRQIKDVVIKTFLACLPSMVGVMSSNVKTRFGCFELYGFDIMLTDTFEAKLIEVNAMPSLQADSALDRHIKGQLIADTLTLVGVPVRGVRSKTVPPPSSSSAARPSPLQADCAKPETETSPRAIAVDSAANLSPATSDIGIVDNNIQWRPQPKHCNPCDIAFWATSSAQSISKFASITDECRAFLALREDQLRRRGGFDAIFPTFSSLNQYAAFMGGGVSSSPPASSGAAEFSCSQLEKMAGETAQDKERNDSKLNPYSHIRFYDLLLAEWERRKEIISKNGGNEQVEALRRWLLGEGPFPLLAAAFDASERRKAKALDRSSMQPSTTRGRSAGLLRKDSSSAVPRPPPTPPTALSSLLPPISSSAKDRAAVSSGRKKSVVREAAPTPRTSSANVSSTATTSSVPRLPSVRRPPHIDRASSKPPTPIPPTAPPVPIVSSQPSRRSASHRPSKTTSISRRPLPSQNHPPNLHVQTLSLDLPPAAAQQGQR